MLSLLSWEFISIKAYRRPIMIAGLKNIIIGHTVIRKNKKGTKNEETKIY